MTSTDWKARAEAAEAEVGGQCRMCGFGSDESHPSNGQCPCSCHDSDPMWRVKP